MSFETPDLDDLAAMWWDTYKAALTQLGVTYPPRADEWEEFSRGYPGGMKGLAGDILVGRHPLASKTADTAVRRLCRLSDEEWRAFRNDFTRPKRLPVSALPRQDATRRGRRMASKPRARPTPK